MCCGSAHKKIKYKIFISEMSKKFIITTRKETLNEKKAKRLIHQNYVL